MQSTDAKNSRVASAFDRIASEYDELWTNTVVGTLQRRQVWRELEAVFSPGDYILEIGCGTGADASHLARNGIRVHAIDISTNMLRAARDRIDRERLSELVTLESRAMENLSDTTGKGIFDGAFSSFGVLNCVQDLRSAASRLAKLIRPGGKVGICLMGRFCAWEMTWFLFHGKLKKAFRRLLQENHGTVAPFGGVRFQIHYPTASHLITAFGAEFAFLSSSGIGVLIPPTCVEPWCRRKRRTVELLSALDQRVRHLPVFRAAGDHRLYWFEKSRNKENAIEAD